jgi:hypothetical protein
MKKESGTRFGGGNEIFLCIPLRLCEKKIISVTELVEVTNKMPATGSGTEHSSLQRSIPKVS